MSGIWLFDALKRTQKIIPKRLLTKAMKKPRLKFNLGLVLIGLQTIIGPWREVPADIKCCLNSGNLYPPASILWVLRMLQYFFLEFFKFVLQRGYACSPGLIEPFMRSNPLFPSLLLFKSQHLIVDSPF